MLTKSQEEYLQKIPEETMADIKPWDPMAAEFARQLILQIEQNTGLEVFWGGSLALGILGQNDIDLGIFTEPNDFDTYLPKIILILGEPTYKLEEKKLWRTVKDKHKIDAGLISKNAETVQDDIFFSKSLKDDPNLLQEYVSIKETPNLTAREYYKMKNEFYNRILEKKSLNSNFY